jgi:hypothetical protein
LIQLRKNRVGFRFCRLKLRLRFGNFRFVGVGFLFGRIVIGTRFVRRRFCLIKFLRGNRFVCPQRLRALEIGFGARSRCSSGVCVGL